jgi:two-component system, NarL family, nitrate/nitrite response regulator NarL
METLHLEDIRVLIVAEDPLARAGLATLLTMLPGGIAGQVALDTELPDAVQVYRPDVIVWDLGSDSARTLERATNIRHLGIPVVALLPDDSDAVDAWASGARALLLRTAPAEQLGASVAAVAQGLTVTDPAFAGVLVPAGRDRASAQPVEELTPRELQVLRLMAEGQSNKAIARTLGISEHTVKFHVNAILGKLNVQSRTEAVVHATRLGLILL